MTTPKAHQATPLPGPVLPTENPGPVPPWMQHTWSYRGGNTDIVPTWVQQPSPSALDPAASYDPAGPSGGPDLDLIGALRERSGH